MEPAMTMTEPSPNPAPMRREKKKFELTDLALRRLNIKKQLQEINAERRELHLKSGRPIQEFKELKQFRIWDDQDKKEDRGLSVLVSAGGTKTFRSTYKLNGKFITRTLGRFGEMGGDADPTGRNVNLAEAHRRAKEDRELAAKGIDPQLHEQGQQSDEGKLTYETVVNQFIDHYAKPRQRTWHQTERVLKQTCKVWLKTPINDITKKDVRELLRSFIAEG
jgi:hypothetical protein